MYNEVRVKTGPKSRTAIGAAFLLAVCALCPPAMAGEAGITGEFIGCGVGQGVLECRIMGDDGKDYYLSCDVGGAAFSVNMTKAQCDAFDENALAGKTVSLKAVFSPDGDVEEVKSLALAAVQAPAEKRRLTRGLTMTGVIKDSDNGPVLVTKTGEYELDPGLDMQFGDIATLAERNAGRSVTLEGDILKDWDEDVFIVNNVKK